jgi:hypothetical protein
LWEAVFPFTVADEPNAPPTAGSSDKGPRSPTVVPGDFATTHVGDETDTWPFPDPKLRGISTEAYIRNMGVLIRQIARP